MSGVKNKASTLIGGHPNKVVVYIETKENVGWKWLESHGEGLLKWVSKLDNS